MQMRRRDRLVVVVGALMVLVLLNIASDGYGTASTDGTSAFGGRRLLEDDEAGAGGEVDEKKVEKDKKLDTILDQLADLSGKVKKIMVGADEEEDVKPKKKAKKGKDLKKPPKKSKKQKALDDEESEKKAEDDDDAPAPTAVAVLNGKSMSDCPRGTYGGSSRTSPAFKLCHFGGGDVISSWFQRDGFWRDCNALPKMVDAAYKSSSSKSSPVPIVVEVGGNIGACTMHMAVGGAKVTVFEPVAKNWKALEGSIHLNKFSDHVFLVPAGAGAVTEKKEIYSEIGNNGNSILLSKGNEIADQLKRNVHFSHEGTINIVKLDDYIHEHVHFLKMDCQGAELLALKGAKKLLTKHGVDVIRSEFDTKLIKAVGSDPKELIQLLWRYDYKLHDEHERGAAITPDNVDSFIKRRYDAAADIIAISPKLEGVDISALL